MDLPAPDAPSKEPCQTTEGTDNDDFSCQLSELTAACTETLMAYSQRTSMEAASLEDANTAEN